MKEQKEIILITGGSGRIGFKTAAKLSEKYRIVGFDVFLAGHLPDVEFVVMDIGAEKSIEDALDYVRKNYGKQITSVIHLAAYYTFNTRWSSHYDEITVKGTQRLLQGLQAFDVEQFIFSSSMLVHCPCNLGRQITENSPLTTAWGYPLSKVQTEEIIRRERGNIPCVILRIAGVYDNFCNSIPLSNQLQRVYEDQCEGHLFAGDTSHGASFLHMDDLLDALWLCIEKRKILPSELTLLIGEPVTLSYDAIQRQMQRLVHRREWKTWSIPKPLAKLGAWCQEHLPFLKKSFIKPWMIDFADAHYSLDITCAKKFLGWQPKHKLEETIPLWIQELHRDPVMWYAENRLRAPHGLKIKG